MARRRALAGNPGCAPWTSSRWRFVLGTSGLQDAEWIRVSGPPEPRDPAPGRQAPALVPTKSRPSNPSPDSQAPAPLDPGPRPQPWGAGDLRPVTSFPAAPPLPPERGPGGAGPCGCKLGDGGVGEAWGGAGLSSDWCWAGRGRGEGGAEAAGGRARAPRDVSRSRRREARGAGRRGPRGGGGVGSGGAAMEPSGADRGPWDECFEAAKQLARRAGEIVRTALTEDKHISTKTSAADLVTDTDRLVEDLIVSELRARFPSHRFIGEEAVASGARCVLTPSPTWIIDPIDGTCNFVHRFPAVAVSIGFAVRRKLEFGVILHCMEERLYTGQRGRGAFCNGQPLRVSTETDLSKALVLTEVGPKRDPATLRITLDNMERVLRAKAHGVRVTGSSTLALCHLASGAADAYYQFGLHCWDLAAATVIIQEAGGTVMDTSGGPLDLMSRRVVAAGTQELAVLVAQALQTVCCGRDDEP
ncbi:inositol monophosphatase 2 [Ctenodactylus gundi]